MQIEIKIDENCKEPKIIVVADKVSEELNALIKRLSDSPPQMLAGFKDETVELLEPMIFSAFLRNPVKCLPKQLAESSRFVCGFTKLKTGWTVSTS